MTCQITVLPSCGDTIINPGEECDDGNARDGDGCNSLCKTESKFCTDGTICGNNVCRSGKTCEDAYCGDGNVQSALNEECDDGNRDSDDDCDNDCKWVPLAECGDAIVQSEFELCDNGNDSYNSDRNSNSPNAECRVNCMPQRCGDGIFDDYIEECDDGNNINGDGCSAFCTLPEGAAPPPPPTLGGVLVPPTNSPISSQYQPPVSSQYPPNYYPPTIPTPARTPTGPGLVIFLASGAAAGVGVVRRRFLNNK